MGGHCADYGFRFGLRVQLLRKTGQHSTASSCTASGILRAGIFDSRRQKSEPCEDFCGDSYAPVQCAPSISRLPRRNMLRRSCLLRRSKRVGTLLRRDSSSPRLCPCFYHSTLLCICQVAAEKRRQIKKYPYRSIAPERFKALGGHCMLYRCSVNTYEALRLCASLPDLSSLCSGTPSVRLTAAESRQPPLCQTAQCC